MKKNGKAALGFFRKEDELMINDKDIRAGAVFKGLSNNKKIVIENVIESKDGVRYVSFYDDKKKKASGVLRIIQTKFIKKMQLMKSEIENYAHIFPQSID